MTCRRYHPVCAGNAFARRARCRRWLWSRLQLVVRGRSSRTQWKSHRRRHDRGNAGEIAFDHRGVATGSCRVPRRANAGKFARSGRMGGRRHQQRRGQPLRQQEGRYFRKSSGSYALADTCNSPTSPTASRSLKRPSKTSTFGRLELLVVCRVQPGKKCWKTSASSKSELGRRLTPLRVRAAKRTPVALKSMDIQSWRANRNERRRRSSADPRPRRM